MTEIFKVKTGINAEFLKDVFEFTSVTYNLRNQSKCNRSIPCTEKYVNDIFHRSKTMGQRSHKNQKFQIP